MPLKDYYQILQLESSADQSAIKKAYRKLALIYHPDRFSKTQDAGDLFREIKEAYEILSDPSKREQYHYNRWMHQSMGSKLQGYHNAYQIYQVILESEKYLTGIDKFRINDYTLLNILLNLFSIPRIQAIITEKNPDLEKNTIMIAMKMGRILKSDFQIQFKERMSLLANAHPSINSNWEKIIINKIASERKSTFIIPVLLFIVIALCIIFYFLGK